jgi:hypothetical protein
MAKVEGAS